MSYDTVEDIENSIFGFRMSRGTANFSIYTKTKHVFHVWSDYFKYYTVQNDFDRRFAVKDLYEKERGVMYAMCTKTPHKMPSAGKPKEFYMAKFIEAASLLEDAESVLYEIRLTRALNSLFFAEIDSIFEHNDYLVIVYQIKYEMNLREYLINNKPLSEETIKTIFAQLVLGLNDAHRSSIILRQLNPELIFINPADLNLIICDLSNAVCKPDLTRPFFRSCIGFIAPEIVEDKKYSSKADCFSLGIIVYMM